MKEVWKDVKDYEGIYQVSDQGLIKVLPREFKLYHGGIVITTEKILKPSIRMKYLIIVLSY